MDRQKLERNLVILILVLLGVGFTVEFLLVQKVRKQQFEELKARGRGVEQRQSQGAPKVPAFELTDHRGETFDRDRLRGDWTFVFFGFTHCRNACPTAMAALREVWEVLEGQPRLGTDARAVFVSVDPARDTRARLASFVEGFHPDFTGVRGPRADLRPLTDALGVHLGEASPGETTGSEPMQMSHSTGIYLVAPDLRVQALFTPPYDPVAIVDRYAGLRHEASP